MKASTCKLHNVHISQDIISDDDTRVKLRRQAQHWRGVTAVADSSPLVKELSPAEPSSYSNPDILPPAYSLHTAAPITSNRLITDYKSSITPSSSYLSDPLNAYAHLGMPKPFVHLMKRLSWAGNGMMVMQSIIYLRY